MARHPLRKSLDVHDDVGKFRHASSPSGKPVYPPQSHDDPQAVQTRVPDGAARGVVRGSAMAGKMQTDAEE
jgi:hypothetical protein